jgi:alpha-1,3-rhamnosyltransferase
MNEFPLVTIGIPNYNYGKYIAKALNSVANQTYRNIELIIVDDFSSDNSCEVIENWINNYQGKFPIRFIQNETNTGISKVSNIILKNAQGKYFQPLDADDIILRGKIESQVKFLNHSPDTAMVYSNVSVIDSSGIITNPDYCNRINYDRNNMPSGKIFNELLFFNFISTPSVLINTEYARIIGGFDETLRLQDYYMWLKLSENYEIKYIPEIMAYYRIHSSSLSNFSSTRCTLEESVMINKYRYYDTTTPALQKVIARNIQCSSVYLYEHNHPNTKKWLSLAFKLKPGFKTFLYFCTIRIGIPFSFFKRMKSLRPFSVASSNKYSN